MNRSRSAWISSTVVYHIVRPATQKHSSNWVRFIRSTKPVVRGNCIWVARCSISSTPRKQRGQVSLLLALAATGRPELKLVRTATA